MSDYTTRLQELVDDLYGDAEQMERQGRALTDAERRWMAALRSAGELVRRAAELLDEVGAGQAGTVGRGEGLGSTVYESIRYRGRGDAPGPYRHSALPGNDDTEGYSGRPRPRPAPGGAGPDEQPRPGSEKESGS